MWPDLGGTKAITTQRPYMESRDTPTWHYPHPHSEWWSSVGLRSGLSRSSYHPLFPTRRSVLLCTFDMPTTDSRYVHVITGHQCSRRYFIPSYGDICLLWHPTVLMHAAGSDAKNMSERTTFWFHILSIRQNDNADSALSQGRDCVHILYSTCTHDVL